MTTLHFVSLNTCPSAEGEYSKIHHLFGLELIISTYRDGHYGLYLDDTLSDGSSARCPTFDNDPLCSAGPRQGEGVTFECVGLEVWGVGS